MGFSVAPSAVAALGKQQERLQEDAAKGGFDRMAEIDLGAMSEQLDEVIAEQARQEAEQKQRLEEGEEPDELFQSIWTDERRR